MMSRTIANGQLHGKGAVEWLTPPELLASLGDFDLDPCAPVARPWDTAKYHYTIENDGFSQPWYGRVWLNPPYDHLASKWLKKLATHGDGIALIFARTETKSFFEHVWGAATGLLFIKGRLQFYLPTGVRPTHTNCGGPSVLVAYGNRNHEALQAARIEGFLIDVRSGRHVP
jgi:hypothetical protein